MNAIEIETWVIRIIDQVLANKPNEDSRVELKTTWPDEPRKTARLIAAHANAARGEPILWIIGVDQNKREVKDVEHRELSNWYEKIRSMFDERHAPSMRDLNIIYNGKSVVALLFDTERFPFVVKQSEEILEVPWREGTLTRSAKRFELLKLLLPSQYLPRLEILSGSISIDQYHSGEAHWVIKISMYIEPYNENRLVIPYHRCIASLEIEESKLLIEIPDIKLDPPYSVPFPPSYGSQNLSKTIESTQDEVLIYGPGRINLSGHLSITELPQISPENTHIKCTLSILPTGAEQSVTVFTTLSKALPDNDNRKYLWKIN